MATKEDIDLEFPLDPIEEELPAEDLCCGFPKTSLRTLLVLCVIDFVIFCTYPLPSPFLPDVLDQKGVNATQTGIIFSIMTGAMFILSPFVSYPSRWFGRKFVFTVGLLVEAAGIVGFAFIDRLEGNTLVAVAITLRVIQGAGAAVSEVLSVAYLVDATPPGKLSKWFGVLEMFPGLGLMAGPPIGGFIYEYCGFTITFVVNAAMLLVPMIFGLLWLPSDDQINEEEEEKETVPLTSILSYKWVWLGMLGSLLPCVSWGLLDTTLEFHLDIYHLSHSQVGLFFLIPALLYLVMSPPTGYIIDYVGAKATALLGVLFLVIGLLFLGPAPFFMMPQLLWVDSVALFFLGLGSALATVPSLEIMVEAVEHLGDVNDEVSGIISSAIAFGNTVGPFLGSTLTEATNFGWCVTIVAGLNGIVVIIYFICSMFDCAKFRKEKKEVKRRTGGSSSSAFLLGEMDE